MRFLNRCKDIAFIEINPMVFKKLDSKAIQKIVDVSDENLKKHYAKLGAK